MSVVVERYQPRLMDEDSIFVVSKQSIGGFLCTADGTVTVLDYESNTLVDALPVTAGVYHPIPIYLGPLGGTVELGGGASGTLCI